MGIREGLLVLLAEEPKHGYQLKQDFEEATGQVWSLNIGQVYTTLQRLERDELVVAHEADEEGRIPYSLTVEGRGELAGWFSEPVDRTVPDRDEVSIKLLVAVASGAADPRAVIDVQRAATMNALQDYTRLREDSGEADIAWLLHIDRLVMQAEVELRWLDRVEARLANPPSPIAGRTTPDAISTGREGIPARLRGLRRGASPPDRSAWPAGRGRSRRGRQRRGARRWHRG